MTCAGLAAQELSTQTPTAADLQATERAYEEQIRRRPSAELWQRLGLVRHLQSRYDAAVPAFREAIRLHPQLWTSHLFLGICLYRLNHFQESLQALEKADHLGPQSGRGRDEIDYWLGAAQIANQKSLAGLRSLERLLQRNPRHREALELAVRTYMGAGVQLWNQVAERHFETAAGYEVHGHALESEGNLNAALAAYYQARALKAERPGLGLAIGRLLLRQGKAEEALTELKREVAISDDGEAAVYAGLAALQLGRYEEAAAFLEQASRDRADGETWMALAQVRLAQQRMDEAVAAARRAVELAPASEAVHELFMTALQRTGRQQELRAEEQRWEKWKPGAP